jgi:hypothetical protein
LSSLGISSSLGSSGFFILSSLSSGDRFFSLGDSCSFFSGLFYSSSGDFCLFSDDGSSYFLFGLEVFLLFNLSFLIGHGASELLSLSFHSSEFSLCHSTCVKLDCISPGEQESGNNHK